MARRIMNRKEMRADYDAAERRKQDADEQDEPEGDDEAGLDEDEESDADESETGDDEGQEVETPQKRKPAGKPARTKGRSRTAKVTRMKVVWGVFNNSNQRVAVFEYARRQDAEEMAAKLMADQKSTHFVQPVKEPLDEKPEE